MKARSSPSAELTPDPTPDPTSNAAHALRIEPAVAGDAEAVAALLRDTAQWLIDTGRRLWTSASFSADSLAPWIATQSVIVAWAGDTLAGTLRLEFDDPYFWPELAPGTSAFVHKLAVARPFTGQGVARALLDFALARTRSLGLPALRLDCYADRPRLRAFYESAGFTPHATVMRDGVEFARFVKSVNGVNVA